MEKTSLVFCPKWKKQVVFCPDATTTGVLMFCSNAEMTGVVMSRSDAAVTGLHILPSCYNGGPWALSWGCNTVLKQKCLRSSIFSILCSATKLDGLEVPLFFHKSGKTSDMIIISCHEADTTWAIKDKAIDVVVKLKFHCGCKAWKMESLVGWQLSWNQAGQDNCQAWMIVFQVGWLSYRNYRILREWLPTWNHRGSGEVTVRLEQWSFFEGWLKLEWQGF